jgi:hypothetical protein
MSRLRKNQPDDPRPIRAACVECQYHEASDSTCRFDSPNAELRLPKWPAVRDDDWCGEFQVHPDAPQFKLVMADQEEFRQDMDDAFVKALNRDKKPETKH